MNPYGIARRDLLGLAASLPLLGAAARATAATATVFEGYAAVPGGRLWYFDTGGSGDAIIFSHPGTGSHESWKHQRSFFAQRGYRVIGYSRWGYGKSDRAPAAQRGADADLVALMDAIRVSRAHIVGVAAGTRAANAVMAHSPQRVLSGTIVGSVIGFQDREVDAVYATLRPSNFHDLPDEFRELSATFRAAAPDEVRKWKAISAARPAAGDRDRPRPTTLGDLAASRVPLLFATGDADLYAPPPLMRMASARVPGSRYATIVEAGHAPFWENPAAFNALLLEHFTASRRPRRRR